MDEMTLNIAADGLEEALERLRHIKGGAEEALMRALNAAGSSVRNNAPKEVVKAFDVNKGAIAKRMYLERARPGDLSVTVGRRGKRWLAKWFAHDPNTMPRMRGGKAVFLRPRRDGTGGRLLDAHHPEGETHPVSKAFLADLPVRGRGIYARKRGDRNSLVHVRGLSAPEMLKEPDVSGAVERGARYALQIAINKEVKKLLAESRGGNA